eukprot:8609545-Alexandrium_andersonii.AAC.1
MTASRSARRLPHRLFCSASAAAHARGSSSPSVRRWRHVRHPRPVVWGRRASSARAVAAACSES